MTDDQHEVRVPDLGESVTEATVGEWMVSPGDSVSVGDILLELETDKVNLEVGAEASGTMSEIRAETGDDVRVGDVIALIEATEKGSGQDEAGDGEDGAAATAEGDGTGGAEPASDGRTPEEATGDHAQEESERSSAPESTRSEAVTGNGRPHPGATPVARRMAEERGIDVSDIDGTGQRGRVTKDDVERAISDAEDRPEPPSRESASASPSREGDDEIDRAEDERRETRERMSRRRRTIARRLVSAQRDAAMLTTFNDVDMKAVKDLRAERREAFREAHGVKLGFMSFFVKATVAALREFPNLNAEIDGDEIVRKHYYDIGMAIGHEEGLVVPVIRDADRLSFAEIERTIDRYVTQVQEGTLSLEALQGGTFSITNGGIFGSLLSTPILNPPQVGILGLHRIEDRPAVVDGELAVRPMMHMALTYDHRIVDGREAVQFLARIKALIEDPTEMLLAG